MALGKQEVSLCVHIPKEHPSGTTPSACFDATVDQRVRRRRGPGKRRSRSC